MTEKEYIQKFIKDIDKKLSSSTFIEIAPLHLIKRERKKKRDALEYLKCL